MRFLALASRNLKETYRDPLALGFLLAFPLVFMLIMGAILSGDTTSSFPVGVIDNDGTPVSQAFVDEALAEVPVLEVSTYEDAVSAMENLKLGNISAYIIIPHGFGEQISRSWQDEEANITLEITYDESDFMATGQIISTINAVTRSFAHIEVPITINANPIHIDIEINLFDYMGPGIIVFGLLILIPMAALPMVRDKEKGFLCRLLTTPTRPVDFLLGYSLSMLVITIAQIILFVVGAWLIGMDVVGNLWLAFLIFFLTGLCSIGIGMVVAALSKSENQAMPLSWLFAMPLATLSGCFFAVEVSLPLFLRGIAYAFPYAHAVNASRAVLIRGVGLEAVRDDFLFLLGWAVVIFAIGVILFRRSMRS